GAASAKGSDESPAESVVGGRRRLGGKNCRESQENEKRAAHGGYVFNDTSMRTVSLDGGDKFGIDDALVGCQKQQIVNSGRCNNSSIGRISQGRTEYRDFLRYFD